VLLCSDLPNVNNTSEMNTYISLWRNNPNFDAENRNVLDDFAECKRAVDICSIIDDQLTEAKFQNQADALHLYSSTFSQVSQGIIDTLDDATAHVMHYSDIYLNDDSKYIFLSQQVSYAVWVNLQSKRKARRNIEFEELGGHLEWDKSVSLAQQRIAIRFIQLKNDILSSTSEKMSLYLPIVSNISTCFSKLMQFVYIRVVSYLWRF